MFAFSFFSRYTVINDDENLHKIGGVLDNYINYLFKTCDNILAFNINGWTTFNNFVST